MGVVFSGVLVDVASAGQVPSGVLLDPIRHARDLLALAAGLVARGTLLHAAATGFASLLGLRLALGLAEAPCFPANSNVVAKWFHARGGERARDWRLHWLPR